MELDSLVHAMGSDGVLVAKNATRFLHFIGLAVGLGAATFLDLMLLRFVAKRTITRESWQMIDFGARLVSIGLMILWATGIAFVVQYALFDPVKLTNEKIWAKLVIVGVLTLNGFFIHAVVMPRIKAQMGKTLFDGMGAPARNAFILSGAISATSWYAPVAIGAFSQLNFQVPALVILTVYAACLAMMIVAMQLVMRLVRRAPEREAQWPLPGYPVHMSFGA